MLLCLCLLLEDKQRFKSGEFDESIISVFNILFESVLFRFDFVLYKYYFLFRTILLQLQVIIFQERIIVRLSLGAKERELGADSGLKYEIWDKNMSPPKSGTWHGPRHQQHGRASLQDTLLLLLLHGHATY